MDPLDVLALAILTSPLGAWLGFLVARRAPTERLNASGSVNPYRPPGAPPYWPRCYAPLCLFFVSDVKLMDRHWHAGAHRRFMMRLRIQSRVAKLKRNAAALPTPYMSRGSQP